MSHRRRMRGLLTLALAALVALPASLALAGPTAHPAVRRCLARGRSGARRCRRAASKVPPVGTTLLSADQKARLTVVVDRTARGKAGRAVILTWELTARCPAGPAVVQLRARAAIRGNAFASTIDSGGVRQRLTGRFASVHKASGQVELGFPDQRGGRCDTGLQRFVVQG